jgi:hypothetical protein
MAEDQYAGTSDRWPVNHDPIDNPRVAIAVTPDDNKDLTNAGSTAAVSYAKALYIGGTGDLKVTMAGDKGNPTSAPVTFKAVAVGPLNIQVRRVWSTGTTATNILALMD